MPASIFSETELARLASFPEEIPGDDLIRACPHRQGIGFASLRALDRAGRAWGLAVYEGKGGTATGGEWVLVLRNGIAGKIRLAITLCNVRGPLRSRTHTGQSQREVRPLFLEARTLGQGMPLDRLKLAPNIQQSDASTDDNCTIG